MTRAEPVVVVGGGLAAGSVVAELRLLGYTGPITLICSEPHPPYERPPLTKSFLRGETSVEDTYLRPSTWYAENQVDLLTSTTATGVDLADHVVHTDEGDHHYGKLVLATGCRARRLNLHPTSSIGVHHLRDLEDARALEQAVRCGARVLVVGGGWIGLEVAASARARDALVTVVEPAAQPLAGTLGLRVGGWFADLHRSHGVDLRVGVGLSHLEGPVAVLDDATQLEVDHVLVSIGALPNDELARRAGLEVDSGVLVDASLITSDPDVLAIGDVACHLHPLLGRRVRVEHWQNASAQGKVAARVLTGQDLVYDEVPSFFSDQYDAGLEFFGHLAGEGAEVAFDVRSDGFVARWSRDGVLLAAGHVNQWNDTQQLVQEVRDSLGDA